MHTSADGKVRAADVEYKLPGESVFRATMRPIHKLVLVVPVEEQAIAGERGKEGDAGAEQPAPLAVRGPWLVQQEETRATEVVPLAIEEPEPPAGRRLELQRWRRVPPERIPKEPRLNSPRGGKKSQKRQ